MRLKLTVAAMAVAAVSMAAPATSSAQTDIGVVCDSLLGSGTINVAVAEADYCLAADEPQACTLTDTIDVLGIVRIRHGLCIDVERLLDERTASVRGLATVRILPGATTLKSSKAKRSVRRTRAPRRRR